MKTVFLFAGQGSQTPGMAGELVSESKAAAEVFACASDILHFDLLDTCLNGTPEALAVTTVAQPAIMATSLAALACVRERGYALSPRQLASMARRFTRWEVRNVFCHKNGYEDFRDQVICLDYDELLEMYVEETVHPAVRPPWQSPGNYAYFQSEVMGQTA